MDVIKNLLEKFSKTKYYLIGLNSLLVFFLIFLSNAGVLPLRLGDFIFFSLMYLIFALYRPGWSFLFLVGTIMLENINLAPESMGIFVRPYQLIGGLTIMALILRFFSKRLNFKLVKLRWFDFMIFVFGASGMIGSLFAESKGIAFKQSMILVSFIALYWLVRNYIQTLEDVKKIAPFFLGSSVVVVFYGIWQNVQFIGGRNSFEVMPGRPNATFTEADWLGIFLVSILAVIYSIIYYLSSSDEYRKSSISDQVPSSKFQIRNPSFVFCLLLLVSVYILLIMAVSRSAWLGAGFITLVFLKAIYTKFSFKFREWNKKEFLEHLTYIAGAILLSIAIVHIFHLTNFQLFNRAQSTGSGLQKITIACEEQTYKEDAAPDKINDISELEQYGCRHINLEDIEREKEAGFKIEEIYRTDPNVNIRAMIYQKSWEEIKNHPIFGVGWGNISNILGKDERGARLNSSNIFLEVWMGSGIIGLLAFLVMWVFILVKSVLYCIKDDFESKMIGTFVVLGLFALLIPNLFNAGAYLGILWVWLGVSLSLIRKRI